LNILRAFIDCLYNPFILSYASNLVYRENTVRTEHVLNYVAVYFKKVLNKYKYKYKC
jgi:hypothetical protein